MLMCTRIFFNDCSSSQFRLLLFLPKSLRLKKEKKCVTLEVARVGRGFRAILSSPRGREE